MQSNINPMAELVAVCTTSQQRTSDAELKRAVYYKVLLVKEVMGLDSLLLPI